MNQHSAPLFDKLQAMTRRPRASFHVPGHKFGIGLREDERAFYEQIMSIDYTEISELDDLHRPHGVIEQAQQLAAQCYGADDTFFLVNGSTAGNLALVLACCAQGDLIIVQRDVHQSVLHGLMLAKAKAIFLSPRIDEASGLPCGVDIGELAAILAQYPHAKAVLLTNPNYYGIGIQLDAIAQLVHSYQMPLLIDEAHGAHFGFHPQLPASALAHGADAVVQSTHKTLSAMTMGSMLHIQGKRIDRHIIQHRLAMLQSSSPSYPLMASLDISRRKMAIEGRAAIEEALHVVEHFKQIVQQWPWFNIAEVHRSNHCTQDPFKIAIKDRTGTLSGFALQSAIEQSGCMTEMADPQYVLLVFSLNSTQDDVLLLTKALQQISQDFRLEKQELSGTISNTTILPPIVHSKRPVAFHVSAPNDMQQRSVPLEEAVSLCSAEMVIPYPPGIPILYPGELITAEVVHYLAQLLHHGANFHGSQAIGEGRLQVIDDV